MFYPIIVLLTAAVAAVWGFRRGLTRQTPAVIGTAFGIICTHILTPGLNKVMEGAFTMVHGHPEERFVYDTISSAIVFFSIYFIFRTVTFFLANIFNGENSTILDNLGGSLFALFKYMLFTSVILNMLVALNPKSDLLRTARADDGNTVLEVMLLSPSVLGGEDLEDLFHKVQLEEAKKISCNKNKNTPMRVYNITPCMMTPCKVQNRNLTIKNQTT